MNLLDWFILAVLGIGIWRGFSSGLIRETARVAAVVLAFVVAIQLMDAAGALVLVSLDISERIAPLVGFVILFIGVLAIVSGVARIIEYVVGGLMLGPVNRLLGGAVGALKASLLLSVFFLAINAFGLPDSGTRDRSLFYEPVAALVGDAWEVMAGAWPRLQAFPDRVGRSLTDVISG